MTIRYEIAAMNIAGALQQSVGAMGRMLLDAAGDTLGTGLTLNEQRLLEPAYLSHLLNRYALQPGMDARILSVARRPGRIESSNCRNLIVDIEQAPGATNLPGSLFIKVPEQPIATRWFFNVINAWALECHFCRHIAPSIPFRTPINYAVAQRGTRFVLVQENLTEDPSIQLHTNRDMLVGPSLELTKRCLDCFAQLHATFAGKSTAERERILPAHMHMFLGQPMGSVSLALNRYSLAPCVRRYPGVIPEPMQQAYRDTIRHWSRALAWWFDGPLTLLHGDSHLGNFFVDGEAMGMLDFQAVHWGKGMRDVQYFLIDSLPADMLAQHERALIAYYCERRATYGAPLAFDTAWRQYRGFCFHALMTIVVSIGLGAMTERNETLEEVLRRAVAACERLDYVGWVGELVAGSVAEVGGA